MLSPGRVDAVAPRCRLRWHARVTLTEAGIRNARTELEERESGGPGRRAGLRIRWPQGYGGSSPPFRINLRSSSRAPVDKPGGLPAARSPMKTEFVDVSETQKNL